MFRGRWGGGNALPRSLQAIRPWFLHPQQASRTLYMRGMSGGLNGRRLGPGDTGERGNGGPRGLLMGLLQGDTSLTQFLPRNYLLCVLHLRMLHSLIRVTTAWRQRPLGTERGDHWGSTSSQPARNSLLERYESQNCIYAGTRPSEGCSKSVN
jgi:hypothetical protein